MQRGIRVGDIVQIRGEGATEWEVISIEPNLIKMYRTYNDDEGIHVRSAHIEGASARGVLVFVRETAPRPSLGPNQLMIRALTDDEWWAECRICNPLHNEQDD